MNGRMNSVFQIEVNKNYFYNIDIYKKIKNYSRI